MQEKLNQEQERYVIGVDLGTSAVKTVLVNRKGQVAYETSPVLSAPSAEGGI